MVTLAGLHVNDPQSKNCVEVICVCSLNVLFERNGAPRPQLCHQTDGRGRSRPALKTWRHESVMHAAAALDAHLLSTFSTQLVKRVIFPPLWVYFPHISSKCYIHFYVKPTQFYTVFRGPKWISVDPLRPAFDGRHTRHFVLRLYTLCLRPLRGP